MSPADAAALGVTMATAAPSSATRRSPAASTIGSAGVGQAGARTSLCLRYYSVTFRGQPLSQMVLSGGEATEPFAQWLAARLDLPCDLGNPLRPFEKGSAAGRIGQWDVAAGLALRDVN